MPRFATATVTELSQIGLLQELPGERITKLAHNMKRAQIPAGSPIVLEGSEGDHFYVILRGLLRSATRAGSGRAVFFAPATTSARSRWRWTRPGWPR